MRFTDSRAAGFYFAWLRCARTQTGDSQNTRGAAPQPHVVAGKCAQVATPFCELIRLSSNRDIKSEALA